MSKLIKCSSCGKEISDTAKNCPGCGAKIQKPIYRKVWFWVVIVILVIMVSTSGDDETTSDNEKTQTSKNETLVLEEGHKGAPDELGLAYYIEGIIKNNSDKEFSYVQVEFTAYDAEGNTIDSCLDNNSGLEANGTWKFKAMCLTDADKIASYKLKEITKW